MSVLGRLKQIIGIAAFAIGFPLIVVYNSTHHRLGRYPLVDAAPSWLQSLVSASEVVAFGLLAFVLLGLGLKKVKSAIS